MLYGWAKDAPPAGVPAGAAFRVGDGTGSSSLVMQVHFTTRRPPGDRSGVRLHLEAGGGGGGGAGGGGGGEAGAAFSAGLTMFARYFQIPPREPEVKVPNQCCLRGFEPQHAFAFRVHAHDMGRYENSFLRLILCCVLRLESERARERERKAFLERSRFPCPSSLPSFYFSPSSTAPYASFFLTLSVLPLSKKNDSKTIKPLFDPSSIYLERSPRHPGASTSVVAKRDPQLPQGFTPVAQELTIWPGDRVTMTCVYDASKSDRVVTAGSTHNDEM